MKFQTNTRAQSTDDLQTFKFTNFAPSTVNFHDIYTNTLALLSDEPTLSTKDDIHISGMPTQFIEFQLPTKTDMSTTTPKINFSDTSQVSEGTEEGSATSTLPTTRKTIEKELRSQNTVPSRNMQRGVLDLLLPAYRVKTFKNVFDTFRKVLSYTFRK